MTEMVFAALQYTGPSYGTFGYRQARILNFVFPLISGSKRAALHLTNIIVRIA